MGNRVKRSNRSNIKWQEKSNSQNSLVKLIPELAALWAETHGNSTVTIALLDGTVDITHPCFVGTNLRKINTINTTSGNDLALEHGTNIASILFANSNKLMQGIVPGCRGLILPIYAESNKKILPCSQLDLARAINQALDAGANIINISGGQFEPSGEAEVYLAKAIKTCIDNKVLVISAAGNNGCNCHHVPASIPGVIAVGAMNLQGKPTEFSNWGRKYQQNGILAPGKDIPTASLGGGVNLKSGTSYAAAIVTGIAALMLSLQIKRGQKLSTYKVKDALFKSAIPCNPNRENNCEKFLVGKLNVKGMYNLLFENNKKNAIAYQRNMPVFNDNSNIYQNINELNKNGGITMSHQEEIKPNKDGIDGTSTSQVRSSGCSCNNNGPGALYQCLGDYVNSGNTKYPNVYALGTLGLDFGDEIKRDNIAQHMKPGSNPNHINQLLSHLETNPLDAASVTWTLNIEGIPTYAILPLGPFAQEGYQILARLLKEQVKKRIERICLPGIVMNTAKLISGMEVPVVCPDSRGLSGWNTQQLVESVCGKKPEKDDEKQAYFEKFNGIKNMLDKIYYDTQNLGITPYERALNYAAAKAFNIDWIFEQTIKKKLYLSSIETERNKICRPHSECWNIKLTFFDPENLLSRARHVFLYTIDVSDVLPININPLRTWTEN